MCPGLPCWLWKRRTSTELPMWLCFPAPAHSLTGLAAPGRFLHYAPEPRKRCLYSKTGLETARVASELQQLGAKQLGAKQLGAKQLGDEAICPPFGKQLSSAKFQGEWVRGTGPAWHAIRLEGGKHMCTCATHATSNRPQRPQPCYRDWQDGGVAVTGTGPGG